MDPSGEKHEPLEKIAWYYDERLVKGWFMGYVMECELQMKAALNMYK